METGTNQVCENTRLIGRKSARSGSRHSTPALQHSRLIRPIPAYSGLKNKNPIAPTLYLHTKEFMGSHWVWRMNQKAGTTGRKTVVPQSCLARSLSGLFGPKRYGGRVSRRQNTLDVGRWLFDVGYFHKFPRCLSTIPDDVTEHATRNTETCPTQFSLSFPIQSVFNLRRV